MPLALAEANRLIRKYNPWHINIDAPLHKFINDVRLIDDNTKTVWFRNTTKLVDYIDDPDNPRIICNRDGLLQMYSDEYKANEIVIVGEKDQAWIDHHHNLKLEEGKFKSHGPDHYAFAAVCSLLPFWNKRKSCIIHTGLTSVVAP